METSLHNSTFEDALAHVVAVLAILRTLPGQPWLGYFERIAAALETRDVEAAVRARDLLQYGGMGGFGDFLEVTPQIRDHYRAICQIIGLLKVHSRYGTAFS